MPRYLDPKNDLVFKKIFGRHPTLLMSFLNAVLPLPVGKIIEKIEYLPAENVPELPKVEKRSIVDVRCYDQRGRHFIVEMQMAFSTHFMQRFLYNVTSVYTRQIKIATEFSTLNPVYGLAIVHQEFSEELGWLHHYQLTHHENRDNKWEDIHLVFLELPKFKPKTHEERKLTALWLRFMTEINEATDKVDETLLDVPEIKQALGLAEEAAFTAEELEAYSRNWDEIRSYRMSLNDKLNEGLEKGRAEGRAEGRATGLQEAKAEMVKKMLAMNLSIDEILTISGLSEDEISAIRSTSL